jgi:hypothetical protein
MSNPILREVKMFGVYARGQNLRSMPFTYVESEQALWLVESGGAEWVNNRGKSLRLLYCPEAVRDISAQMGPRFIEAVAAQKKWAQAILAVWLENHYGRVPSQSGRNGRIARDSRALARGVQSVSASH